jgi:hypothetical protein
MWLTTRSPAVNFRTCSRRCISRSNASQPERELQCPRPKYRRPGAKVGHTRLFDLPGDGEKFKSLRRHLVRAHDLTPEQYRMKWGLPVSYPMTAPNYAAKRSELAKKMGLGQVLANARRSGPGAWARRRRRELTTFDRLDMDPLRSWRFALLNVGRRSLSAEQRAIGVGSVPDPTLRRFQLNARCGEGSIDC